MGPPGWAIFDNLGHYLNKFGRGPLGDATDQIRVFLARFDDRYSVVFTMPKSMFFSQFE